MFKPFGRLVGLAATLATFLLAPSALAYRPFDGTDADVADEGEYELELGPIGYVRDDHSSSAILPWIVNNYGFAKGFEAVLEARHFVGIGDTNGLPRERVVDTGLFVKTVLLRGSLQGERGISIAVETGPLLPQWHDDTRWGFSFGTIFSERWDALTLHMNVVNALERTHQYDVFAGLILEGPDAWKVRPVAEVFVEQDFTRDVPLPAPTRSALVGTIAKLGENVDLDAAVRVADGEGGTAYEGRLGFTLRVEVVKHEPE